MSKDYSAQYDELYQYGARNIINNKDYSEEGRRKNIETVQ